MQLAAFAVALLLHYVADGTLHSGAETALSQTSSALERSNVITIKYMTEHTMIALMLAIIGFCLRPPAWAVPVFFLVASYAHANGFSAWDDGVTWFGHVKRGLAFVFAEVLIAVYTPRQAPARAAEPSAYDSDNEDELREELRRTKAELAEAGITREIHNLPLVSNLQVLIGKLDARWALAPDREMEIERLQKELDAEKARAQALDDQVWELQEQTHAREGEVLQEIRAINERMDAALEECRERITIAEADKAKAIKDHDAMMKVVGELGNSIGERSATDLDSAMATANTTEALSEVVAQLKELKEMVQGPKAQAAEYKNSSIASVKAAVADITALCQAGLPAKRGIPP